MAPEIIDEIIEKRRNKVEYRTLEKEYKVSSATLTKLFKKHGLPSYRNKYPEKKIKELHEKGMSNPEIVKVLNLHKRFGVQLKCAVGTVGRIIKGRKKTQRQPYHNYDTKKGPPILQTCKLPRFPECYFYRKCLTEAAMKKGDMDCSGCKRYIKQDGYYG